MNPIFHLASYPFFFLPLPSMNAFQYRLKQFKHFGPEAQRLLKANFMFGLLMPFYIIFSNTFIFGNTDGNLYFNFAYSALHFVGNPVGFILCGYLLRRFHIRQLFAAGLLLILANMAVMVSTPKQYFTYTAVLIFGLLNGMGSGLYWSVRNYLTVISTHDDNRNFFTGLDQMFFVIGGIATPFVVGNYIGWGTALGWFSREFAYGSAIFFASVLAFLAVRLVWQGNYPTVKVPRFLFYRYLPEWRKARLFVFVMGFFHAAFIATPAVLVMMFVGNESAVGFTDSISQTCAMLMTLWISSKAKPHHRTKVMLAGTGIFTTGALVFTGLLAWQPAIATVLMVAAFYFTDPTINFPYRASFMKVLDQVKAVEKRDAFTYGVDIEQFNAAGRLCSIILLVILLEVLPASWAFPAYFISVAAIQFINVLLSKRINTLPQAHQPT